MKTRPWPIVLLAIFYLLGPFYNIYAGAQVLHLPFIPYLTWMLTHAPASALAKLLIYPVAGIAIFAVKNWSFPVYLASVLLDSYFSFQDWRHFSKIFTLPMFIGTVAFNAVLVGYFLLPSVRAAYFNKRLRWWESKPRYPVRLRGTLKGEKEATRCTIINLSEGGALVKTSRPLDGQDLFELHFLVLGKMTVVSAKVVHSQPGSRPVYGLQFQLTDETERAMKRLTSALKKLGLEPRTANPVWWRGLKDWFVTLVTTGKGIVPEVPKNSK